MAAEATAGALRFCGFIVERASVTSDTSYLIDFDSTFGGGPYTENGWTSLQFDSTDTSGSVAVEGVTFNASWTGGGTRSRGATNATPITRDFAYSDSDGITLELGEAGSLPAGTWEVSMWSYDSNVPIVPAEVGYRVDGVAETVTGTGLPEDSIFPVATFQFTSDGISNYEVFLRADDPGASPNSPRLNAVTLRLLPNPVVNATYAAWAATNAPTDA